MIVTSGAATTGVRRSAPGAGFAASDCHAKASRRYAENLSRASWCPHAYSLYWPKMIQALCPPKPKLLLIATLTSQSAASLGV